MSNRELPRKEFELRQAPDFVFTGGHVRLIKDAERAFWYDGEYRLAKEIRKCLRAGKEVDDSPSMVLTYGVLRQVFETKSSAEQGRNLVWEAIYQQLGNSISRLRGYGEMMRVNIEAIKLGYEPLCRAMPVVRDNLQVMYGLCQDVFKPALDKRAPDFSQDIWEVLGEGGGSAKFLSAISERWNSKIGEKQPGDDKIEIYFKNIRYILMSSECMSVLRQSLSHELLRGEEFNDVSEGIASLLTYTYTIMPPEDGQYLEYLGEKIGLFD